MASSSYKFLQNGKRSSTPSGTPYSPCHRLEIIPGGQGGAGGNSKKVGGAGGNGDASRLTREDYDHLRDTNDSLTLGAGPGGKGGDGDEQGGRGGDARAFQMSSRLIPSVASESIPDLPMCQFSERYKLNKEIAGRLKELGFGLAASLFEITTFDLEKEGFRAGHIAQLTAAMKKLDLDVKRKVVGPQGISHLRGCDCA
ncbi:hypothetical protein C8J57DRAFT_1650049 [Mycena rebaudengoi]|nr:hypothetical protein C8J57DRAFT_1650049 [Mycena rebaudengoi]